MVNQKIVEIVCFDQKVETTSKEGTLVKASKIVDPIEPGIHIKMIDWKLNYQEDNLYRNWRTKLIIYKGGAVRIRDVDEEGKHHCYTLEFHGEGLIKKPFPCSLWGSCGQNHVVNQMLKDMKKIADNQRKTRRLTK